VPAADFLRVRKNPMLILYHVTLMKEEESNQTEVSICYPCPRFVKVEFLTIEVPYRHLYCLRAKIDYDLIQRTTLPCRPCASISIHTIPLTCSSKQRRERIQPYFLKIDTFRMRISGCRHETIWLY
jgi:hypothetical protein